MSEKENASCDPKSISCSDSHTECSVHSDQRKGENCEAKGVTENSFDPKGCSDVEEEIWKEANIPVENAQFYKDKSTVSNCSSASEEFSDPVGHVPSTESNQSVKEVNKEEEHEIEMDKEVKEMQKDWTDKEIEEHKEEALPLKNKGNENFRDVSYYEEIETYTQSLNTCPLKGSAENTVVYANRAAARVKLEQMEEAVLDYNKEIDLNPDYLKALLRKAQLDGNLENLYQCLANYQKVLELDSNSREADRACVVLPQKIAQRKKKLKALMLDPEEILLPVRCDTCMKVIGNKWEPYLVLVQSGKSKKDALDALGLKRHCCRAEVLSYVYRAELWEYYARLQK